MCDKEFKELVKIAVEKLKDESVLKLLQADASYQKESKEERDMRRLTAWLSRHSPIIFPQRV